MFFFLNYDKPYPLPGAWSFILNVSVPGEVSTPKFLVQAYISLLSIKSTYSRVSLT